MDTELKFLPISRSTINTVQDCLQASKVLKVADSQLMVDMTNIVPTLVSSKLIFRHSDNNVTDKVMRVTSTTTPELFHKACDNKGPTLTLISANYGFVFGAYSPIGWVPEFCYSETNESFIFCLRRPRGIPDAKGELTLNAPFVCHVKPG